MTTLRIRLLILLLSTVIVAQAQKQVQQKLPEKTRILFLLDASGSMLAKWDGEQSRMDVAKSILSKLVDSLRANPDLELALRVYGHRYPRQSNNCQDSYLEVPFGLKNHSTIINKLRDIKPKGVTPITYSITQAAKDFPQNKGYRNILILITDGIESCDGDPCAASIELQRKGVLLRPYVIGLGLSGGKVLDCVGQYVDANNSSSFQQILNKAITTTFAKTTVSIELVNAANQAKETNVNVTFLNTATNTSMYEFVHYLSQDGKPDSVQIDPVLGYDLIVNTIPPITKKNISIVNGQHTVIRIPAAQGNLTIKQEGRAVSQVNALIRERGKTAVIHTQPFNTTVRYLAGAYEVEALTLPRRTFPVQIVGNKSETVTLPAPALVNINTITSGYGSLYEILGDGREVWVVNLDETRSQHSYHILPGNYKVVFRAKEAGGSKYTGVKTFSLQPGQTATVNVF